MSIQSLIPCQRLPTTTLTKSSPGNSGIVRHFDRSSAPEDGPLNIVLYTKGSGGDIFPFIRCGQELRSRGHQVTLITHCVYEARARNSSLDFVAIDNPPEYETFLRDQELLNG